MDKYRNSSMSLNSTVPSRLLNTGPLYTMGGSKAQQQGPQLLMNSPSVGTSTQFQFVPARNNSSTNFSASVPLDMGIITPIFNSVKTFFVNLMKRNVDVNTNSTYEKRKCNSSPNIYTAITSDGECSDEFEKNSSVDLNNLEMLAKLSTSTKSFSDYNLPTSVYKANCTLGTKESKSKMDLNCLEQPKSKITKEITEETLVPSPVLVVPFAVPVTPLHPKENKIRAKMPHLLTKSRKRCVNGKRVAKKSTKSGKNKKEKGRHELALKIHEDVETDHETMSTDEWEEPLVIVTATKTNQIELLEKATSSAVCFTTDDFPAMPDRNNLMYKQTWELPRLSHCLASLKGIKQRQISECDSEDSFIVFDDKSAPSSSLESNPSICDRIRSTLFSGRRRQVSESSDDDFICFELENSDADDDDDDCDQSDDSECESEVDVKSCGTNPPDSGFEDKKVRFNLKPVVHVLRAWSFAYQQARKGEWEQIGRDRVRFHERVKRMEPILLPILDSDHRQKIYQRLLINSNSDNCDNEVL